MKPNSKCAFCDCEITKENDSREHIIPNAIGGHKKVSGFICRSCNNTLGKDWESKVAKQLNWFALGLGIKRERGKNPDEIIVTVDGTELSLRSDATLTAAKPFCEISETDGRASVRFFARDEAEARSMLKGVKDKYPSFDVAAELGNLKKKAFKVESPIQHRFEFGGPETLRSATKTAVAYCYSIGIQATQCPNALKLLKSVDNDLGAALFYTRDLVLNRPTAQLFHLLAVRGDPSTRLLLGYVEYFGVMRILVLLSQEYDGEPVESVYSMDPTTGAALDLGVGLEIPQEELSAVLSGRGVVPQVFDLACRNAQAFVSYTRNMRERHHVHRHELSEVSALLGLKPGERPAIESREKFCQLMEERIGPFSELMNIPPFPKK